MPRLPWVNEAINYVESEGSDVLSGPFTGCFMALYKRGGTRRVAHVHTPECRDLWARIKQEAGVEFVKEFQPHDS